MVKTNKINETISDTSDKIFRLYLWRNWFQNVTLVVELVVDPENNP